MNLFERIVRLEHLVETKNDKVKIVKMENGFYWLVDIETEEYIDGDSRLWVVKDMAKRWGLKIIGSVHRQ